MAAAFSLNHSPFLNLYSIATTFILLILSFSFSFADQTSPSNMNLHIQPSKFATSIQTTINVAQNAKSTISQFSQGSQDSSLSGALNDCVELLDDSVDHLYSVSEILNRNGDRPYDPCHWNPNTCSSVSAVLSNQEICLEGMDQVNSHNSIKYAARSAVNLLNPWLSQLLSVLPNQTQPTSSQPPWRSFTNNLKTVKVGNEVTVAKDGSGMFRSIQEAVNAVPWDSNEKFIIHIKQGTYSEYIEITKHQCNVVMIGEGMGTTVITGNKSNRTGYRTFDSATFIVGGCGFIARDITFENTAGIAMGQAVALRSNANNVAFYRCAFKGYQDTLYAKSGRQFFRDCKIYGSMDFIFGDATAVFQNCEIIARNPGPKLSSVLFTAQGRKLGCSGTGFSFHKCTFKADDDLRLVQDSVQTYLGRPWKEYSRAVVMNSYLGPLISTAGWTPWNKSELGLDTIYYGEYMNNGPGSDVKGRVKWPGYHPYMSYKDAIGFTARRFLAGDQWLPVCRTNSISESDQNASVTKSLKLSL